MAGPSQRGPGSRGRSATVMATALGVASVLFPMAPASGAELGGCGQQFTFLGVTAGDPPVAWITEDIGDACGFSFLIQLAVRPDTVHTTVTQMSLHAEWEWLVRGQVAMKTYAPPSPETEADATVVDSAATEARPRGPVISHRRPPDAAPFDPLPVVTTPPLSEERHLEFLAHIEAGGSDAVTWNAERGADGILPPLLDGIEAEIVYAYPHGLYVNYDVVQVERLPAGYFLLLTMQPALGIYHNTMHGFLVVRERARPVAVE